jgi:hypothetical protein
MKPKNFKKSGEQIWQDTFVRDLYFGGVLFTELLQDCYDLGTYLPLWMMSSAK